MQSASCLCKTFRAVEAAIGLGYSVTPRDKPFADVAKRIGLSYDVTPRCMRNVSKPSQGGRAAQRDGARAQRARDAEMQRHGSTVSGDEMRAGFAQVIDIATGRDLTRAA